MPHRLTRGRAQAGTARARPLLARMLFNAGARTPSGLLTGPQSPLRTMEISRETCPFRHDTSRYVHRTCLIRLRNGRSAASRPRKLRRRSGPDAALTFDGEAARIAAAPACGLCGIHPRMLSGGHRARLDGNWVVHLGEAPTAPRPRLPGGTRSRLAHPADGSGVPTRLTPMSASRAARVTRRGPIAARIALQGEVLDVQCLNPALRVTPLPLLRPQLLPAQLGAVRPAQSCFPPGQCDGRVRSSSSSLNLVATGCPAASAPSCTTGGKRPRSDSA